MTLKLFQSFSFSLLFLEPNPDTHSYILCRGTQLNSQTQFTTCSPLYNIKVKLPFGELTNVFTFSRVSYNNNIRIPHWIISITQNIILNLFQCNWNRFIVILPLKWSSYNIIVVQRLRWYTTLKQFMFVYIEPHNVSRDRFISMRTKQISHWVERVEYSLKFIQKIEMRMVEMIH